MPPIHRSLSHWDRLRLRLGEIGRTAKIPLEPLPESPHRRIAICGRTNVGKSSFVNALVDYNVSVVRSRAASARPIYIKYGAERTVSVMDGGILKGVSEEVARAHTFDDNVDSSWAGFVWMLPRAYLRRDRYRLVDTPGLGDERLDDTKAIELLRNCEFRLVLFKKSNQDMLSPISRLFGLPFLAVRTQADGDEIDAFRDERRTTLRELEKRSGGLPVPLLYTSVTREADACGSVYVPLLATRLDVVFAYGSIFRGARLLLDQLEQAESQLTKAEETLTAAEAATIYGAWGEVKRLLDGIKSRREKSITTEDAEQLNYLVSIPLGNVAWKRVTATYGAPPVAIGRDPNGQYRDLEKWFLEIDKRTTLERRRRELADRSATARSDVKLLLSLAAALLVRKLGDELSATLLFDPFSSLDMPAAWRQFALRIWED